MSIPKDQWPAWVPDDDRVVGWDFTYTAPENEPVRCTYNVEVAENPCPRCGTGESRIMSLSEYEAAYL